MVDIDYGIPLDIRDAALKMAGVDNPYAVGSQSRNAEVKAIMADKMENRSKNLSSSSSEDKREKAKAILETLAAKLSSGTAPRPKQRDAEISNKELSKTISKLPFGGTIETPEDKTIRSFFIFGFSSYTPQYTITSLFEKFGSLASVKIIHQARCGYITFAKRTSAEECAEHLRNNDCSKNTRTAALLLLDKKEPVRVSWGVPKHLGNTKEEQCKIAIVVNKVMKQLADKDAVGNRTGRKSDSKKTKESKKSGNGPEPTPKKTYKSMAQDFEI
ncbi:hypothetical protein JCM33374_g5655 [Metschnikowia sp. JCM 33374]|nr:hypothetical protein JCM33374_g5655 [Metschnikowia sp. JCM 33374]